MEPVPGRVQPRATAHRPSLTTTGLPAPTRYHPSELRHRHSLNLLVWYIKTPHILIASHICGEMASMSKIILYLSKCIHMNTCWYFRSLLLMTNREGWWKSKRYLLSFEGLGQKKKHKEGEWISPRWFPSLCVCIWLSCGQVVFPCKSLGQTYPMRHCNLSETFKKQFSRDSWKSCLKPHTLQLVRHTIKTF